VAFSCCGEESDGNKIEYLLFESVPLDLLNFFACMF